jgi:hypothetical protein
MSVLDRIDILPNACCLDASLTAYSGDSGGLFAQGFNFEKSVMPHK